MKGKELSNLITEGLKLVSKSIEVKKKLKKIETDLDSITVSK